MFTEVHSSYKFVLLTMKNAEPADSFHTAFYLHDIEALNGKTEKSKFLHLPTRLINLTSPEVLAIPEVRSNRDVEILKYIYKNHSCVRDGLDNGKYTISFVSELHRTNDSQTVQA